MKLMLKKEKKLILVSLVIGIVITFTYVAFAASFQTNELQEGIASKIIRFHCIANSDSTEDQALKLKVRDEILRKMRGKMSDSNDINETRRVILENIEEIKNIAEGVIKAEGKDYKVVVKLEKNVKFPVKQYGEIIIPAGEYEALRVIIGSGEGKNWWCVMYPPLCFVDEAYAVVDTKTNAKLHKTLTNDEYKLITENKKVNIKFKLFE